MVSVSLTISMLSELKNGLALCYLIFLPRMEFRDVTIENTSRMDGKCYQDNALVLTLNIFNGFLRENVRISSFLLDC